MRRRARLCPPPRLWPGLAALALSGALALAGAGPGAAAACRQALVLALDVSGSVDDTEYRLQLDGLAKALETPQVQQALFAMPGAAVSLAIFEWSGQSYQRVIQDWQAIDRPATLAAITRNLRLWSRSPAPEATSIGGALAFAGQMLARAPDCWKRTLDVSGDGKNNDWPLPQRIRKTPPLAQVTINALVIGAELLRNDDAGLGNIAELSAYFTHQVIQGPDAFVEVALGFENYSAAMARKLLKELQTAAIGSAPPSRVRPFSLRAGTPAPSSPGTRAPGSDQMQIAKAAP